jgi:hypothetical protein
MRMVNKLTMLREIKEGFDIIKVGNHIFDVQEREGSEFLSFSNRCEVLEVYDDSPYKVGDEVIVHHHVKDQVVRHKGQDVLLAYPDEILAVKKFDLFDMQDDRYLENFVVYDGVMASPITIGKSGAYKRDFWVRNVAKTFNGELIEYLDNADYEIIHREKMYYLIKNEDIFMKDGKIQKGYEEIQIFNGKPTRNSREVIIQPRFIKRSRDRVVVMKTELMLGEVIPTNTNTNQLIS